MEQRKIAKRMERIKKTISQIERKREREKKRGEKENDSKESRK